MDLFEFYLKRYLKEYKKMSYEIRNDEEKDTFMLSKEYIWIAIEYLKDERLIQSYQTVDTMALDKERLRKNLKKLERNQQYMLLDSILRFLDDVVKVQSGKEDEDIYYYHVGLGSSKAMSTYYLRELGF